MSVVDEYLERMAVRPNLGEKFDVQQMAEALRAVLELCDPNYALSIPDHAKRTIRAAIIEKLEVT